MVGAEEDLNLRAGGWVLSPSFAFENKIPLLLPSGSLDLVNVGPTGTGAAALSICFSISSEVGSSSIISCFGPSSWARGIFCEGLGQEAQCACCSGMKLGEGKKWG